MFKVSRPYTLLPGYYFVVGGEHNCHDDGSVGAYLYTKYHGRTQHYPLVIGWPTPPYLAINMQCCHGRWWETVCTT